MLRRPGAVSDNDNVAGETQIEIISYVQDRPAMLGISCVVIFMKTFKFSPFNSSVPEGVIVRVKARAVRNKRWQRLDPSGGRWGLFGLHTVPDDATEVVVTEVNMG